MWRSIACIAVVFGTILSGCNPAVRPQVSTAGPPPVAVPPANLTVAEKISLVADALRNTLPVLGVTNPKVAQGLSIVDQLADLAQKISAGGGGTSLGTLVLQASSLIETFGPAVGLIAGPYAPVVDAAVALLPQILQLAGIEPQRAGRMGRAGMTPGEAEAILHRAARR